MSDEFRTKRVILRETEGRYVIQGKGPEPKVKPKGKNLDKRKFEQQWRDERTLPEGAILRDAEQMLKMYRESFPEALFRLTYKRTETVTELEIGAHEEIG